MFWRTGSPFPVGTLLAFEHNNHSPQEFFLALSIISPSPCKPLSLPYSGSSLGRETGWREFCRCPFQLSFQSRESLAAGSTLLRPKNKMANYRSTCSALTHSFCQGGSWGSGNNLAGGGRGGRSRERAEECTSKK